MERARRGQRQGFLLLRLSRSRRHVHTGATAVVVGTTCVVGVDARWPSPTTLVDNEELPNGVKFTYSATATFNDGTVSDYSASKSATITAVNDAPAAIADNYDVNQGASLVVAASCLVAWPAGSPLRLVGKGVLCNDTDSDSASLTAIVDARAVARHAGSERGWLVHLHAHRGLRRSGQLHLQSEGRHPDFRSERVCDGDDHGAWRHHATGGESLDSGADRLERILQNHARRCRGHRNRLIGVASFTCTDNGTPIVPGSLTGISSSPTGAR